MTRTSRTRTGVVWGEMEIVLRCLVTDGLNRNRGSYHRSQLPRGGTLIFRSAVRVVVPWQVVVTYDCGRCHTRLNWNSIFSAVLVRLIGTREMEVAWVDDFSCLIYGATKKKIPIHICK